MCESSLSLLISIKTKFPLESIPSQYQKYLEETENIESEDYEIISSNEEYVGDLDSDDFYDAFLCQHTPYTNK